MFEDKIIQLLNTVFDSYIEGIDQSKLAQMNLWGGKIVLNNLHIRPDVLEILELPFHLTFGFLGSVTIRIQIPLLTLSRKNLGLEISDLIILTTTEPESQWDPESYRDEYISNKIARLSAESLELVVNQLEGSGFMWNTALSFLETLEVTLHNVHIRVEDFTTNNNVAYAFGCVIKNAYFKLNLDKAKEKSVDLPFQTLFTQGGKLPSSIKHRTIDLEGFGLYIDQIDPLSRIKSPSMESGVPDLCELDKGLDGRAAEEEHKDEETTLSRVSKSFKRPRKRRFASKVYPRFSQSSRVHSACLFDEPDPGKTEEVKRIIEHTNAAYNQLFSDVLNYLVTSQHHLECSHYEDLGPEDRSLNTTIWDKSKNVATSNTDSFGTNYIRNTTKIRASSAFKTGYIVNSRKSRSTRSTFKSRASEEDLLLANVFQSSPQSSEASDSQRAEQPPQVLVNQSWRVHLASFCRVRELPSRVAKSSAQIINSALKRRHPSTFIGTQNRGSDPIGIGEIDAQDFSALFGHDSQNYADPNRQSSSDYSHQERGNKAPTAKSALSSGERSSEYDLVVDGVDEILDEFEKKRHMFPGSPLMGFKPKLPDIEDEVAVTDHSEPEMNEVKIEVGPEFEESAPEPTGVAEEEDSDSGDSDSSGEEPTSTEESENTDTDLSEEAPPEVPRPLSFECKVLNLSPDLETPTTMDTEKRNSAARDGEEHDSEAWTCITYVARDECGDKVALFLEGLKDGDHNYILNTRDFKGLGSFYFCTYPIMPSKKYTSCWSEWGSKYGRAAPTRTEYLPNCSIFLVFEDLEIIMSKEQIECILNLINHNVIKFFCWMSGVISTFENPRATPEDEKLYMEYWPQFLLSNPEASDEPVPVSSAGSEETPEDDESSEGRLTPDVESALSTDRSMKLVSRKEMLEFVADFEILHSIPIIRILRNRASDGLGRLIRAFSNGSATWKMGKNVNECITNLLFMNICASYDKESTQQGLLSTRLHERLQFVGGIYEIVSKHSRSSGIITSLKKLCTQQSFTVDLSLDFLFLNSRIIVTNNMHTATDETNIKGYILCANGLHLFYQDTYRRDGSQFLEFEASPFTVFSLDLSIPAGGACARPQASSDARLSSIDSQGGVEAGGVRVCPCQLLAGTPCILMTCGDSSVDPLKKNKRNLLSLLLGEDERNYLLPPVLYCSSDYNHFRIPETSDVVMRLHLDSEIFMHFPIIDELSHILRIYKYNMDRHASTFPVKIDDQMKRLEHLAKEDSILYELVDLGIEYQQKILQGSISYLNYDLNIDIGKGLFLMFDVNLKGSYYTYAMTLDEFTIRTLTRNRHQLEGDGDEFLAEPLDSDLVTDSTEELMYSESIQEGTCFNASTMFDPRATCVEGLRKSFGSGTSAERRWDQSPPRRSAEESSDYLPNLNLEGGTPRLANGLNAYADEVDLDGYDLHMCKISGFEFHCLNAMNITERSVYMAKDCSISLTNYLNSVLRIKTKYLDKIDNMGSFMTFFEKNVKLLNTDRDLKIVVKTVTNMVPQNNPNLIVALDVGSLYVNLRDVDMVGLICSLSDYKQIILKYAIKLDVVSERDIKDTERGLQLQKNKYHDNAYLNQLRGEDTALEYFDDLKLNAYYKWNLMQEGDMGERSRGFIKYEMNLEYFNLTFNRLISFNTTNSYYAQGNPGPTAPPAPGDTYNYADSRSHFGKNNAADTPNLNESVNSQVFGQSATNDGFNRESLEHSKSRASRDPRISALRSTYHRMLSIHGFDLSKLEDYVKFYGIATPLLSFKVTGLGLKVGFLDTKIERICAYVGALEIEDQSNCVPLYTSTLFSGGNTTMLWSWLKVRRQYSEYRSKSDSESSSGDEDPQARCQNTVSRTVYGYYKRVQRYIDATMDFDAHSHNHIYNTDDQENLNRIIEAVTKFNQDRRTRADVNLEEMYLIDSKSCSSASNAYGQDWTPEGNGTTLNSIIAQYKDDYTDTNATSAEERASESQGSSAGSDEGVKEPERVRIDGNRDSTDGLEKNMGIVGMVFGGCPCFVSLSLISGTTRNCSIYVSSSIVNLPWEVVESLATYVNTINAYIKDNIMKTPEDAARPPEEYDDDSEYTDDVESTAAGSEPKFGSQGETASVAGGSSAGEDDETLRDAFSAEAAETPSEGCTPESDLVNRQFYKQREEPDKKFSFHVHVGISCMNLFTESAWTGYGYFLKYMYHKTTTSAREPAAKGRGVRWSLIRNILHDKNRKAYMIYPITMNITGQGSLYLTHIHVTPPSPDGDVGLGETFPGKAALDDAYRRSKFDLYSKSTIDEMFDGWFHFMPCVFEVKLMSRNVNVKLTREASGAILTPLGYTMCDLYLDVSTDFRKKRASFIKHMRMSLLVERRYHALANMASNSLFDLTNLNTSKIIDPFRSTISAVFYLYGNDRKMWSNQIMPQSVALHVKLEPMNVSINCVDVLCLIDLSTIVSNFLQLFKYNYTLILHASNEFLAVCNDEYTTLNRIRITRLFSTNSFSNAPERSEQDEEEDVLGELPYSDLNDYTSCVSGQESWYTNARSGSSFSSSNDAGLDEGQDGQTDYQSSNDESSNSSIYEPRGMDSEMFGASANYQQYYDSTINQSFDSGNRFSQKDEVLSSSSGESEDPEEQSLIFRLLATLSVGLSLELELVNVEIVSNVTADVKHMFALTLEDTSLCFWVNSIFDCEYLDSKSRIVSIDMGEQEPHRGVWFNDPLLHRERDYYPVGDFERENVAYLEQFSGVLRGGVLDISSCSLPQAMKSNSNLFPEAQVVIDTFRDSRNVFSRTFTLPDNPPPPEAQDSVVVPAKVDAEVVGGESAETVAAEGQRPSVPVPQGPGRLTQKGDDVLILINEEYTPNVRYSIRSKKNSAEKTENLIGVQVEDDNRGIGLENILKVDEMIDVQNIPSIASINKLLGGSSDGSRSVDYNEYEDRELNRLYKEHVNNFLQFRFRTNVTVDLCREGNREMAVETFSVSLMGYKPSLATKLFSRLEASWINVNVTLNAAECYFGFLAYFSVMLKLKQLLLHYAIDESKLVDSVTRYTIHDHVPRLSNKYDASLATEATLARFSRDYADSFNLSRLSKDMAEYSLNRFFRDSKLSKERISKMLIEGRLSAYPEVESATDLYSLPLRSVNKEMFPNCLTYRYNNGLLQPCGVIDINSLVAAKMKFISEMRFFGIKKIEPLYLSLLKFDPSAPGPQSPANYKEEDADFRNFDASKDIYSTAIEHNVVHLGKLGHANVFGRARDKNESSFHNNLGQPVALAIRAGHANFMASINTLTTINTNVSNIVSPDQAPEPGNSRETNAGADDAFKWVILNDGESLKLPVGHYGILEPFLVRVQIRNKSYDIASNQIDLNFNDNQIMFKLDLNAENHAHAEGMDWSGTHGEARSSPGLGRFVGEYVKRLVGRKDIETTYDYAYIMVKVEQKTLFQTSNTNASSVNIYLSSGISVLNKSLETVVVFPSYRSPENRTLSVDDLVRIARPAPLLPEAVITQSYFKRPRLTEFDRLFKPISVLTEHKLVKRLDPVCVSSKTEALRSGGGKGSFRAHRGPEGRRNSETIGLKHRSLHTAGNANVPLAHMGTKHLSFDLGSGKRLDPCAPDLEGLQYLVLRGNMGNASRVSIPLPWIMDGTNTICVALLSDFNEVMGVSGAPLKDPDVSPKVVTPKLAVPESRTPNVSVVQNTGQERPKVAVVEDERVNGGEKGGQKVEKPEETESIGVDKENVGYDAAVEEVPEENLVQPDEPAGSDTLREAALETLIEVPLETCREGGLIEDAEREITCDVLLSRETSLHIISSFEGHRIKVPVPGFVPVLHLGRVEETHAPDATPDPQKEALEKETRPVAEPTSPLILSCTLTEFTTVHKTQIPLNPMKHCLKQYELILESCQIIENMMPYDVNILAPHLHEALTSTPGDLLVAGPPLPRALSFDHLVQKQQSGEEHMDGLSRSITFTSPKEHLRPFPPDPATGRSEYARHLTGANDMLFVKSGSSVHLDTYLRRARILFKDFYSHEVQFKNENMTSTLMFEKLMGVLLDNCRARFNVEPRDQASNLPNKMSVSIEVMKRSTQPTRDKDGLIRRYLASSQIVCTIYADKWVVNWLEYPILLSRSDGRYIQCFGGNGCSLVSQDLSNTGLHIVLRKTHLNMIPSYDMYPTNPRTWAALRVTSPAHLISNKFLVPELTFSSCSIKDMRDYPNLHYLIATSIAPLPFFRTVVMEIMPQVTITNDFDADIWIREYITSKNVVKTVIKKTGIFTKLHARLSSYFHKLRNTRSTKNIEEGTLASDRITLRKYSRNVKRASSKRSVAAASRLESRRSMMEERSTLTSAVAKWIRIESGTTIEFHPQAAGEFYVQVTAINPLEFQNLKHVKFWSCSLLIKPSSSTQFRYPQEIKHKPARFVDLGSFSPKDQGLGEPNAVEGPDPVRPSVTVSINDAEFGPGYRRSRTNPNRHDLVKYGLCEVETLLHKGCKMVRFSRPTSPEWVIINSTGFNLYIQQLGILSHGEILDPNTTLTDFNLSAKTVNFAKDVRDSRELNRDLDGAFKNGIEYGWYDPLKQQKLIVKLHHLQDKNNETIGKYLMRSNTSLSEDRLYVKVRGVLLIDLGRVESINTSNIFNIKIGQIRLAAKVNAQTSVIMGQRTLILTCGKLNKLITRNKKLFDIYKQIRIKIPSQEDLLNPRKYLASKFKYNLRNNIKHQGIRVSARTTGATIPLSTRATFKSYQTRSARDSPKRRSTRMLFLHHTSGVGSRRTVSGSAPRVRHTYPLSKSAYRDDPHPLHRDFVIHITNDYTLNISLAGLGICICSYLPDELLYLSLVLVRFSTSFQDNESRYVFSVGWLQSDVHDVDSFFPTMIKPVINYSAFNIGSINKKKASSYVHHDIITNTNREVISIVMNTRSNRYIREISLLSIDIQPININLDTRIIFSTLLLLDDYLAVFLQSERTMEAFSAPLVGIFNADNMQSFDDDVYLLSEVVKSQYGSDSSSGSRYNISRLLIGKIVMVINIRRSDTIQVEELPPLSPMVRYLVYIVRRTPHISDAHIVLNKESLLRLCCTPYVLMTHFGSRYVSQAMHQIYKVLWAVDLIGNPKMIFNHWFSALYQSLIDFREALRFVHLPPVTFLLLLKGVSQFGVSVLSGIVDAFYRFTGSWCLLLNTMALNSDRYAVFLLNEVFPKNFGNPSNVFEGLYFGTMMMGRNLYISLGNFVFKPVNSFNKFVEAIRLKSGKREVLMSFLHIFSSMLSAISSLFFGTFSSVLSGLSISLQGLLTQMHSVPMLSAIRPRRSFQHLKSTGPIRYNFLESWSMEASKRIGHTNQVLLVLPLDVRLKLFDPVYLATSHWSVLATHISSISPLILSQSFGNFKDLIWIDRLKVGYVEKGHILWRYNIKSISRIQLVQLEAELSRRSPSEDYVVDELNRDDYYYRGGGERAGAADGSPPPQEMKVVIYDSYLHEKKLFNRKVRLVLPLKVAKKLLGKKLYFMRIIFTEPRDGSQFYWSDKKKIPAKLQMALESPNFLRECHSEPRVEPNSTAALHKQIHEGLDALKKRLEGEEELDKADAVVGASKSKRQWFSGLYNAPELNLERSERPSRTGDVDEGERDIMLENRKRASAARLGSEKERLTDSSGKGVQYDLTKMEAGGQARETGPVDEFGSAELEGIEYELSKRVSEDKRGRRSAYVERRTKECVQKDETSLDGEEEDIYEKFNSIISDYTKLESERERTGRRSGPNRGPRPARDSQPEGPDREDGEVVEIVKMPNLETGKLYFTLLTSVIREVAL